MSSLHEELVGDTQHGACKVCTYLASLPAAQRAEWRGEIALPLGDVGNAALVVALRRRGVTLTEASVRRHRDNHV